MEFTSMIEYKDGHIPSPLIIFECTVLSIALLECQMNNGVCPKASKSKLKVDRADHSNYFNINNDGGKNTSYCTGMGCILLTLPGIADTNTYLMNTWNTPPESYQQKVYKITRASVKHQIQQAENPKTAVVISVEAELVDHAIILDYLPSEVGLVEHEIGSANPDIAIDSHCTDDKLHFGMPECSRDDEADGGASDKCDAISTACQR
jgi:hypothetical protein